MAVFQDPRLARNKPNLAFKHRNGGIWKDRKGLSWTKPNKQEVWEYNIAIAKEAYQLGFDEINFDYVRFPSDGKLKNIVYDLDNEKRYEVMTRFWKYLSKEMAGIPISIDLFGMVLGKAGKDDLGIGQRLVDTLDHVDYVCPMVYPSHYPRGYINIQKPAKYPARIISHEIRMSRNFFMGKKATLRPWLQAFSLGGVKYGANEINSQIRIVEQSGISSGWLLWNAGCKYPDYVFAK